MAVFQGGSGLPEDRFINTFHFHDPTLLPYDAAAQNCRDRVEDFYLTTFTGGSIGMHMSVYVNRPFQLISYNMLLPAGERTPTAQGAVLPSPINTDGLPEELAVCLTIRGVPPWTPRRRGRVYLGPWADSPNVLDPASTAAPARVESGVAANITDIILARAAALADDTESMRWCIRSSVPTENYVVVDSGYVDDAFDIQRRRGPDATLRTSFTHL